MQESTLSLAGLPKAVGEKVGVNLHHKPYHPLRWLRLALIKEFTGFHTFDRLPPAVTVEDNFDRLLIPHDHPSRKPSDTYYLDNRHVLRTHTSAHQFNLLKTGYRKFLVIGDVYRKDEIDRTHYPVFHQVEGVAVYPDANNIEGRLHNKMTSMLNALMPGAPVRKVESYFPFTHPSWEYEVQWEGKWLEVAGCGVVHPDILKNADVNGVGWAFGMGLERIAMALYGIPDIRLFWSNDSRFIDQFKDVRPGFKYKVFSDQPPCTKDITFWVPDYWEAGEFFQLVRDGAGDLVENVQQLDKFEKGGRTSYCYRITYRSMDRVLTNEEINILQNEIRYAVVDKLKVELR